MRVWLAPSAFYPHRGGVEELTAQLAKQMLGRGHEVLVVTNRWPRELLPTETVDGVDVRRVPFELAARRPSSLVRVARSYQSTHDALAAIPRPDVVHVQCVSSQAVYLRRYCEQQGVPLVVTTQGETAMDAQGLYQHNPWMRRELRRSSQAAAALTACSSWTRDHAASIAPAFAAADVVLNGVTPTDWRLPAATEEPVFAAWGRHVEQKGFDLLLDAWPSVRMALPGARLLLGGDGPTTPALRATAGEGVELVGPLDRGGVHALLGRARVVVVPSRVEPFGIVAVEALGAGRGLVYSTRGGLVEAAGGCGRGVDPFERSALVAAMLAEHGAPTPAAAGVARAQELSWDLLAHKYEHLYDRVTSGTGGTRK